MTVLEVASAALAEKALNATSAPATTASATSQAITGRVGCTAAALVRWCTTGNLFLITFVTGVCFVGAVPPDP